MNLGKTEKRLNKKFPIHPPKEASVGLDPRVHQNHIRGGVAMIDRHHPEVDVEPRLATGSPGNRRSEKLQDGEFNPPDRIGALLSVSL